MPVSIPLCTCCYCVYNAALVFGMSATAMHAHSIPVRMHSLAEWSDSNSSIDSMPSSADESDEGEDDWPTQTGFHVRCVQLNFNNVCIYLWPSI